MKRQGKERVDGGKGQERKKEIEDLFSQATLNRYNVYNVYNWELECAGNLEMLNICGVYKMVYFQKFVSKS